MTPWIIGSVLVLQTLAIAALLWLDLRLFLALEDRRKAAAHYEMEAERLKELAMVEHHAARNLVEAVRRGDVEAVKVIVKAWEETRE